ncbi:PREDICTED: sodium-independent sulfate anion transporter [Nicrophorus vespilloides]|uniref:Sodium-independent sulfate anion transporter n=1 Tax=Nicrophorus vespilloides TaxID=110193 RepID=A0ABM1MTT4_NICVS|nr:PREDICTED: sodium-independent sulfate anion transporter [Nicrophorus vespilloides]
MGQGDDHRLTMEMKQERDLQGVGGGGLGVGYSNPALAVSTNSVANNDSEIRGSNAFILVDDEKMSAFDNFVPWFKRKARNACTKKMLYKRVPILNWLPKYNLDCAVGDLVAGITVGLTVIPQSLAYSNIAGLPPQFGLYGSFLGCLVYILFGSCKDVPMGPTAIASLLTFQSVNGMGIEHAILLCFLTGLIEVLMGLLGLGFLIDFVSGPVSSGFTSAVALIIVTSQVKDVLGIVVKGNTFLEMWISIGENIKDTRTWDTVLGVVCIVILLLMRLVAMVKIGPSQESDGVTKPKQPTIVHKIINKTLWLIGTSRNAILVILCGVVGYLFSSGEPPFKLIGEIPQGLPEFKAPVFSVETEDGTISFIGMVKNLGSGLIVVPLIALLENIAICKAFADGKAVDATQELIAIGLSNVANSFAQGFPGTGSLSRSAVNNSSGVKTPLGGLYTALLVILSLLFFTPYFSYIPKSALAAIIIAAVVFMVEVKVIKPMWKTKKSDLIPGFVTFAACLVLPLEIGILVGIGINLLFILYHAARPKLSIEKLVSRGGIEYLMLTPDRCLIFPSVDYVRNLVTKHSIRNGVPVVIDCSHIYGADYTAATVIETLTKDFVSRGQPLFFFNLKPSVCAIFEGLAPKGFHVYYNPEDIDRLLTDKDDTKPKDIMDV